MTDRRARIDAKKAEIIRRVREVRNARKTSQTSRTSRRLPTSGGEETFTNATFGSTQAIGDNNCYGFAVDKYRDSGNDKLQPGQLSSTTQGADDLTRCDLLAKRTLADLATMPGGGYAVDAGAKCKRGYYKVMSFVDPGNDYHWYRQMGNMIVHAPGGKTVPQLAAEMGVAESQIDAASTTPAKCERIAVWDSGLWAHKRGLEELTTRDASGRFISDPRDADRKYPGLNYKDFCGAYCINSGFGVGA
jgi:hypothetical protein